METTELKKASEDVISKRRSYKSYSGKELIAKLVPKTAPMLCIKEDEIELEQARTLRIKDKAVWDITDPNNPREVPADEVYLIGW